MKKTDRPPIIAVVGWSNSGKTTFLVNLIKELKKRGHCVGTIKNHHGPINVDKPGTDTWHHAQAGASSVVLVGDSSFALFKEYQNQDILKGLPDLMPEVDIIIAEGFKSSNCPKIEVRRSEINPEPAVPKDELIALVSEDCEYENIPCFSPNGYKKIADLIEELFIV